MIGLLVTYGLTVFWSIVASIFADVRAILLGLVPIPLVMGVVYGALAVLEALR